MTDKLTDTAETPEQIKLYQMIQSNDLPVVLDIDKTQGLIDAMLVRGSMIMYGVLHDPDIVPETRIKADLAILKYADHLEKRLNKPKEQEDLVDDI
jgi:hypothetical protein